MIPLAVNSTTLWLYDNIYFYIFIPRTKYEEEISTQPLTLYRYIVKLREREGQRVDLGRLLKGHL